MRSFWWDGLFAEGGETVWFQFFTLYALFLGAGPGLIGVLTSVSNLASAASTLPGAAFAERTGRYKAIVLAATTSARLVFLVLAAMPWFVDGASAIAVLAVASLLRATLGSFAMPAWNAMAAETVPERVRGRYFAFRNFGRQAVGLVLTPLVGAFLAQAGGAAGWQVLWAGSAALGLTASLFFARIPAPSRRGARGRSPARAGPLSAAPLLEALRDTALLRFVGSMSLFQLSVMLAGPFFSVYLVQHLGASPFWVGITAAASPLSAALSQPFAGRLADFVGPRRLLVASNAAIVALPLFWVVAFEPWHIVAVNLIGGAAWAGAQMASFNFLLASAPAKRLPGYTALYQMTQFAVTFAGPLAGGLLIGAFGFRAVFAISAAGRLAATGLQAAFLLGEAEPAGEREARQGLALAGDRA